MAMASFKGEEVDVCVIGSGAGGAPIALSLALAGARVVVLEKGPWLKREDFNHDEIENSRRNRWVPFGSDEPHLLQRAGEAKAELSTEGWIANCVGGGTVHMSGFFYRLHPEDFALSKRYGKVAGASLADWPISYADMAPYYDRVEEEIGISGKAGDNPFEPPRNGDYPLPPLKENPLARLVDQGAAKLGLHPFKTPRAIISRPYKGRPACMYCNFCGSYGCEVDAKSSTLATLVPRAVQSGKCEVRADCMAYEISVDKRGKVDAVHYYDKDGKAQQQRARLVVLSATAVESARLLLNSTTARFASGLANGSGLVGRNLSFSTLAKGYGEFEISSLPEDLKPNHHVHFLQRSLQDFYFLKEKKGGYDKGGTLNFLLPHRNPIFTAERLSGRGEPALWGSELQRALKRHYKDVHELEVEVFGEFMPNPGTRVTVDGEVKDRWGIPSATIHVDNHPLDVSHSRILVDRALELFRAAGAQSTGIDQVGATTFVLQHGTCRFGNDPATSVLDKYCRTHEVDNLYVVDGSFMPTSGGVPTTLTIMANGFRVADHIVSRMSKGTGV